MNANANATTTDRFQLNPVLADLAAYVPGEQPRRRVIKLNTNECPYPPSPRAMEALRGVDDWLRKYPEPTAEKLRAAIGERLGFPPEQVVCGNGSDEILRLLCHAFAGTSAREIGMLDPTYSFYPVIGAGYGLASRTFAVDDEGLPSEDLDPGDLPVFFLTNPNPPFGARFAPEWVAALAERRPDTLFVIDEAYADFAEGDCVELARERDNVIVTRTFSKSYSLAFLRFGFAVGPRWIVDALHKLRDPYNVNGATQAAALATWEDRDYFDDCVRRVKEQRARLTDELRARGFRVRASEGNFVFASPPDADGAALYQRLRERDILVRYFKHPRLADGVRVTIGTPEEIDALLAAL